MAHDDEALDPTLLDPTSSGPASVVPTSSGATPAPLVGASDNDFHDDDALADALAAEYAWLATAAIPIVAPPADEPDTREVAAGDVEMVGYYTGEAETGEAASSEAATVTGETSRSEPEATADTAVPSTNDEPVAEPAAEAAPIAETVPIAEPVAAAVPYARPEREFEPEPEFAPEAASESAPDAETAPDAESVPGTADAISDVAHGSKFVDAGPALAPAGGPQPNEAAFVPEAEPFGDPDAPLFLEPHLPAASGADTPPSWEPPQMVEPTSTWQPGDESGAEPSPAWEPPGLVESAPQWEGLSDEPITPTFVSPFDPPAMAPNVADAPWSSFPAPDPLQAVEIPGGPPQFLAASPVSQWPTLAPQEPDSGQQPEDSTPDAAAELLDWEPTPWEPDVDHNPSAPDEPQVEAGHTLVGVADAAADDAGDDDVFDADRPAPNAWTAWAPLSATPAATSEWDAAALGAARQSEPDVDDSGTDGAPLSIADPERDLDPGPTPVLDVAPDPDVTPEPASEPESEPEPTSEPEPEEFPWNVAAAAAAAAPPLVQLVESEPFNWSITPTGKIAYLDEQATGSESDLVVDDDRERMHLPEPEVVPEPEPGDYARIFLPPPLIEPIAPLRPESTEELPSAPPPYLPVGAMAGNDPADGLPVGDVSAGGVSAGGALAGGVALNDDSLPHPDPEPTGYFGAAPEPMIVGPDPVEPDSFEANSFEALFAGATPTIVGGPASTGTGSITIIDRAYEEELDDDVDETDRAFAGLIGGTGIPAAEASEVRLSPPSEPLSTVRIAEDESVFFTDAPASQRVFSLESSGPEPTPIEQRAGRAARLFWLWFSANSSIISVALGATVFAAGMSLRQSIVAVLAGVALSFIPLALTTLAGKRSGQPTMIVSRATFGLLGNVLPAVLAVVSRLFWGAVLLWLLAASVSVIVVGPGVDSALAARQVLLVTLAVGLAIALAVSFVGYPLLARIQLILSVIAGILIVGLVAMTAQFVDLPAALTVPDGSWLLTITGAVLVFSFVGLVWAYSGADLARYQRPRSSGASSMLWATFGTTVPTFVLICYGSLLAASDRKIATGFTTQPLQTLSTMLPDWYAVPLILATVFSLVSGVTISLYSGGLALQSVGVRLSRRRSTLVVGALLGVLAVVLALSVTGGMAGVFRDLATSFAVPTAAWAGIFAAEIMIRNRRFESDSLLRRGGVYPDVRWVNLVGFIVISLVGFALTTASVGWLAWQGFGFTLLGLPVDGEVATTDLGVLVALVLGLMLPLATAIPAIRRQEAARV